MKNHVEWPDSTQAFQQVIVHGTFSADSSLSSRQTCRQYWHNSAEKQQKQPEIALEGHPGTTGGINRLFPVFCRTKDLKIIPEQNLKQRQLTTPAKQSFTNIFFTGMSCPPNWCESMHMQFKT
jgi:hypothetical protein